MSEDFITVVAGALRGADGRWLMHRRPEGKHHAGLWEFPGGKVESFEMPVQSLVRELAEELGIRCRAEDCEPAFFAESEGREEGRQLVILLYTLAAWEGEPRALEGGAVAWFSPAEALALPKPPLDVKLAQALLQNH